MEFTSAFISADLEKISYFYTNVYLSVFSFVMVSFTWDRKIQDDWKYFQVEKLRGNHIANKVV